MTFTSLPCSNVSTNISQRRKHVTSSSTATCPYLDPVYLDFLQGYCYNPEELFIQQEGPNVTITVEGNWYRTILWKVPILCLVSENFYDLIPKRKNDDAVVIESTKKKMEAYNELGVTIAKNHQGMGNLDHIHCNQLILYMSLKQCSIIYITLRGL